MNPRKILGVSEDAGLDEIQRAYRKAVAKHHPDMGGDAWAFQQVSEAYELLIAQSNRTAGFNQPTSDRSKSNRSQSNRTKPAGSTDGPSGSANTGARSDKEKKTDANKDGSSGAGTNQGRSKSSESFNRRSTGFESPPKKGKAKTGSRAGAKKGKGRNNSTGLEWRNLFAGELPLQTETSMFILVNVLDIFMTRLLLAYGAIEANPVANFFLQLWGFNGMIVFKLLMVSFVCLIAQVVATKRKATGRWLLIAGSLIVGAVVIYSVSLYLNKVAR